MDKVKPFGISKHEVWRAYKRVKSNKGAAGADGQSIEEFERDLKNNLYKLWNRMSSGSYLPPPVRSVDIPKKDGGKRTLGIPTVADRVAQMVVKHRLEPVVEPKFHPSSFGYRPERSAHQAVEAAKVNCWTKAWVLDLDIKGFFDNVDHDLMMKAVRHHTDCKWTVLYIERWLRAPIDKDGQLLSRDKGTPQGGVISPLLANLYLHHAFDEWMSKHHSEVQFERYADDIVVHCWRLDHAESLLSAISKRLGECKLTLHPEKTKIVFCKDGKRTWGQGFATSFDFLGFTFAMRSVRNKDGGLYNGFMPAMSIESRKKISQTIRKWKVGRRADLSLEDMSRDLNPTLRGWVNYYGKHYKRAFNPVRKQFHLVLTRWAMRKYKRFRNRRRKASGYIYSIARRDPKLFYLWEAFYESHG